MRLNSKSKSQVIRGNLVQQLLSESVIPFEAVREAACTWWATCQSHFGHPNTRSPDSKARSAATWHSRSLFVAGCKSQQWSPATSETWIQVSLWWWQLWWHSLLFIFVNCLRLTGFRRPLKSTLRSQLLVLVGQHHTDHPCRILRLFIPTTRVVVACQRKRLASWSSARKSDYSRTWPHPEKNHESQMLVAAVIEGQPGCYC